MSWCVEVSRPAPYVRLGSVPTGVLVTGATAVVATAGLCVVLNNPCAQQHARLRWCKAPGAANRLQTYQVRRTARCKGASQRKARVKAPTALVTRHAKPPQLVRLFLQPNQDRLGNHASLQPQPGRRRLPTTPLYITQPYSRRLVAHNGPHTLRVLPNPAYLHRCTATKAPTWYQY